MASPRELAQLGRFERSTIKRRAGQFPKPVVIAAQLQYRHTFVILHGRGSTAEKFGAPLLEIASTPGEKLQTAFPNAKIVFLTASRTRATIYKKSYTHHDRTFNMEWTTICCNSWNVRYSNHIKDIAKPSTSRSSNEHPFGQGDDDPFSHSGSEDNDNKIFERNSSKLDLPTQAISFIKEEINIKGKAEMVFQNIPVFLGHGTKDEKVGIEKAREAKGCLEILKADVELVEYDNLKHWYSGEILSGIFEFLGEKLAK
ncbi:hypothetical protein G7Y89_g3097 [Cudoniella acicularis]|uniref:Phospholipase/carboxylesterase/thioesterase domain-containing protein n=1 Tax=Cudoniella acicularis TaxID=354080 RepID=A0A8H4W6B3_9HELO|nr:hypothetical protein G7Y89_g3097 [Cudoniella acicularis]